MDSLVDFITEVAWWGWIFIFLVIVAIHDIFINKKHIILHNFPFVGHLRYFLEGIGPESRQYIVALEREELPFNRNEGKELLEITHACAYEHPCQYTMDDVDINLSDKNITKTLSTTFGCSKTKVPFTSVRELISSPYLGGTFSKETKTETKEIETEETSVSKN